MKRLGIAVLAAVAIACGVAPTPTAPTAAGGRPAADTASVKPADDTRKIALYFYSDDDPSGGQYHLVGLPVRLSVVASSGPWDSFETNRQGAVTTRIQKAVTKVYWETGDWNGYCAASGELPVPYATRQNFFDIHSDPAHCSTP